MPNQRATIRTAVHADLLGQLQLLARSDEGLRPGVERVSDTERSTWDRMLSDENLTVYIAEIDTQIVGTAMLLIMPNLGYNCRPSGFIEAMVVSAKHRRRGIGFDILQRVVDDAGTAGCHKLQLLTHKRHATDGAHDFYRSIGFEAEAEGFRRYL